MSDPYRSKPLLWGKHCRGDGCDDFNEQRSSCICQCSACKPPRAALAPKAGPYLPKIGSWWKNTMRGHSAPHMSDPYKVVRFTDEHVVLEYKPGSWYGEPRADWPGQWNWVSDETPVPVESPEEHAAAARVVEAPRLTVAMLLNGAELRLVEAALAVDDSEREDSKRTSFEIVAGPSTATFEARAERSRAVDALRRLRGRATNTSGGGHGV